MLMYIFIVKSELISVECKDKWYYCEKLICDNIMIRYINGTEIGYV